MTNWGIYTDATVPAAGLYHIIAGVAGMAACGEWPLAGRQIDAYSGPVKKIEMLQYSTAVHTCLFACLFTRKRAQRIRDG